MRAQRRRAVQGEPRTAGKGRRTIPGMGFADTKKNNAPIVSRVSSGLQFVEMTTRCGMRQIPNPHARRPAKRGGEGHSLFVLGKSRTRRPPSSFFHLPSAGGESEREEGGELSVPADGKEGGRPPPLSHLHTNFPPGGKGSCT